MRSWEVVMGRHTRKLFVSLLGVMLGLLIVPSLASALDAEGEHASAHETAEADQVSTVADDATSLKNAGLADDGDDDDGSASDAPETASGGSDSQSSELSDGGDDGNGGASDASEATGDNAPDSQSADAADGDDGEDGEGADDSGDGGNAADGDEGDGDVAGDGNDAKALSPQDDDDATSTEADASGASLGAIWDNFSVHVKQPRAGDRMYTPEVGANDYKVKLDAPPWAKTEADVLKELAHESGASADQDFEVYAADDKFEPGMTYYGVVVVHLTGTGADAAITNVAFEETEYVKQIGEMARDPQNENVLFAFSVTIPAITVTVEFGAGHEAAAQEVSDAMSYKSTVSGSTLTYLVEKGSDMWYTVAYIVRLGFDYVSDDHGVYQDGEYRIANFQSVNVKPLEDYPDAGAWNTDFNEKIISGGAQESDVVLYVQWLHSTDVTLKVEPPVCGTEVKLTENPDSTFSQSYVPNVEVVQGDVSIDESRLALTNPDFFAKFGGIIEGGTTYGAVVYLEPYFGYYLTNDVAIEGGTRAETSYLQIPGFIVIAVEAVHDYGDWNVTSPASCVATGERERVCAYNAEHVERQTLPIDPDAHKWGEWTVTKEATDTEAGERRRVCENDASHVQTEAIPAKGGESQTYEYRITQGANATWTKGSTKGVSITVKRSVADETCFGHFAGVDIDGTALAEGTDFTASAGSTVVTMATSMLENLEAGAHRVTIRFDDGSVSTGLTVRSTSTTSNEDDATSSEDDTTTSERKSATTLVGEGSSAKSETTQSAVTRANAVPKTADSTPANAALVLIAIAALSLATAIVAFRGQRRSR